MRNAAVSCGISKKSRCWPASGFCKIPHPKYQNRHPVCKVCGHCVLRGNHMGDASDLDEHPGLGPEHAGQGPSLN